MIKFNTVLCLLALAAAFSFKLITAEEHTQVDNTNSNNHKLFSVLKAHHVPSGTNNADDENDENSSDNDDAGIYLADDSNEIDVLKRAKYRYGKRSAMPYRFGRKRSWQPEQPTGGYIYVKLTPQEYIKFRLANSLKNDNEVDSEEMASRAFYRYGRK